MSEPVNAGWGWDRFSYTPIEVRAIAAIIDLNGGSIYDAVKSYLLGMESSITEQQLVVLRLIFIAENRDRLLKSIESLELGVRCSDTLVAEKEQ